MAPPSASGRTRRRLVSALAALAITLATVIVLQKGGALEAFMAALATADHLRLLLAMAIVPVIQFLRAWRFKLVLGDSAALPDRALYRIGAILATLNFLVPLRIGELSFPIMLKRELGIDFARSAGALALTRAVELLTVSSLLLGFAGFLLDEQAGFSRSLLLLGAALCLVGALILPALGQLVGGGLRRLLGRMPRLSAGIQLMLAGLDLLRRPRRHLLFLTLTFAVWGCFMVSAYLSASAVAPEIGFAGAAFAYVASSLAFALPVNGIAGLGPPQAAWWGALQLLQVESEPAIVTALVSHVAFLLGSVAVTLAVLPLGRAAPARPDVP